MGSTRPEREYQQARAVYSTAAHDLVQAMAAWEAARVPLLPGPAGLFEPWTDHQIKVTVAAAQAWQALVSARRSFEALARRHAGEQLPVRSDRRR